MATEEIEHLELPREDWYDDDGRINKDALIENFNAIESKINELADISAFDIATPDWSSFNYDDTTLESADNKIINLKSFIDIMNLKGLPLVCSWDDKVLTKLQYYNDNYTLVTITNTDLSDLGTDNKIWVYLDYSEDIVYISADATNPNNDVLIACYDDGIVHRIGGLNLVDVNILQVCADMNKKMVTYADLRQLTGNYSGWAFGIAVNGSRAVGLGKRESGGANFSMTFRDFGV